MNTPHVITIIEATIDQLPQALGLLRAQFGEHTVAIDQATTERGLRQMLLSPSLGWVLLAMEGEKPIGIAVSPFTWTLERGGLTAWLDELYVIPEKRGNGVGQRLLQASIEKAQKAGCAALELEVEAGHERAANLYAREGFQRLPRVRWARTFEASRG